MPDFTFRFYFQEMDEARRICEIKSWGGNIGTAFNRAWKALKLKTAYHNIPKLRPTTVDIAPPKPRGGK